MGEDPLEEESENWAQPITSSTSDDLGESAPRNAEWVVSEDGSESFLSWEGSGQLTGGQIMVELRPPGGNEEGPVSTGS